jgi:hypothetical protein
MKYRRIRFGQLGNDPVVDFAIQELQRCLKQMDPNLIVEVLRTNGVEEDFPKIIWVGVDERLDKKVLPVIDPKLDDAITISVDHGHGCITGSNNRSVLIAVYRFLKALGCDWVRPGREGERIPVKEIKDVCVHIQERPSYRHRGVCIEGANSYENILDMIDYLPKVGMNCYFVQFMVPLRFFERFYDPVRNPLQEPEPINREEAAAMTVSLEAEIARRGICYHKTGHGWTCEPFGIDGTGANNVGTSELAGETVQYLAQVDGVRGIWNGGLWTNLCYSNPKVRDIMTDAIVRYCQENRHVDVLHFWLADGVNNHCECENCVKKRPADWYVMTLNELDEKMARVGLENKIVFLLYDDLLWAPLTERLKNHHRFILMFAPITRTYGRNYVDDLECDSELAPFILNHLELPDGLAENLAYLRSWQEQFEGDSFIFDYHLMWAHVADPGYEFCARNLFEDMKNLDKIGLNGMVSCQVQRCAFPTSLPFNMMANALWDKECNFDEKALEYYHAAFGQDGAAVHSYLSEISRLFRMYESPANGHPVYNNRPLCRDYEAVARAVGDILPVIQRNVTGPLSGEWHALQIHTEYVKLLSRCLELLEQGDRRALKKTGLQLGELINRSEPELQKQMDAFNTHRINFLRLGLRKADLATIPD